MFAIGYRAPGEAENRAVEVRRGDAGIAAIAGSCDGPRQGPACGTGVRSALIVSVSASSASVPLMSARARHPSPADGGAQGALISAMVVSSMRLEKPHSLSYHDTTFTKRPSMTFVSGAS